MPRSNGYRPKAAVRKEVLELRARLAELDKSDWVKAGCIMENITTLLGHRGGPMGGRIEPRACKYCHRYGHTKQWCKERVRRQKLEEERYAEIVMREDAAYFAQFKREETEWTKWNKAADRVYHELLAIKDDWDDAEWHVEFYKRTGHFDFENNCVNYPTPQAALELDPAAPLQGHSPASSATSD